MSHGIVDVLAFQEALLIEAVFGIALLTLMWVGFRRWIQYKERFAQLIAEQATEGLARYGARLERVEEQLKAVEHLLNDNGAQTVEQIDVRATNRYPDVIA